MWPFYAVGDSNLGMNRRPYTVRRLEKVWDKANQLSTEKYGTPRIRLYQGLKHSFVSQRLDQDYTSIKFQKFWELVQRWSGQGMGNIKQVSL